MKKLLLVAVVVSFAFAANAFAAETPQGSAVTKTTTAATQTVKAEGTKATETAVKKSEPTKTVTTTTTKVETKATEGTKTASITPTKVEMKPVTTTASLTTMLKGNITKLDNTSLWLKDNAGKEWTFKVGTISLKEYKIGDNVEVKYEKDSLKSIAKAVK